MPKIVGNKQAKLIGSLPFAAALLVALASWRAHGQEQTESQPQARAQQQLPEAFRQLKLPPFTADQVARGRILYDANCAMCHGADLSGGPIGRPLKGRGFTSYAVVRASTGALLQYMMEKMPPGRVGQVTIDEFTAITALMMRENGMQPGPEPLPANIEQLRAFRMPIPRDSSGGLAMNVQLPKWTEAANPALSLSSVTDAKLRNPPPGDWLLWRRTLDGLGYSPLTQINRLNVGRLRLAWAFNLPPGPNAGTPLVHDGVLFASGSGDAVHALNAATGELLWSYRRPSNRPGGATGGVKRNMALYGDKLFIPTSDNKVIALKAATGEVVWESPTPAGMTGGPLVVNGVVVQGLGQPAGPGLQRRVVDGACGVGGRILGMNAADGKLLWTFNVVPQPGEYGIESWNDLPCENRAGGAIWTTSYFDPDLNLIFSGTANTYDTGPLLKPLVRPGLTNDALFTNSTLALDPKTGKLVWHFQHMANEQWDLDWMFEQQIVPLSINGKTVKTIVTIGKPGILDAVDASNGKYLFSLDPGLQDVIQHIDPKTGKKIYDPAKLPGGEAKMACPQVGGAKSWTPSSYNPVTGILYAPLTESCMLLEMVPAGEVPVLSSGVRYRTAPRPDSDGKIGRVQAFDLKNRKVLWSARQRAPLTSGMLATAGGLFFTGGLDRGFAAYDDRTGKQLWTTRLADVPTGAPISFSVGGKQFVAIVTGYGTSLSTMFNTLVPEIQTPATSSSMVYVFAVG